MPDQKDRTPSDLEHDRGGPNENADIDRQKREAANPPLPTRAPKGSLPPGFPDRDKDEKERQDRAVNERDESVRKDG